MTKFRWIRFDRCAATLTVALMMLTAAFTSESRAQIGPSLKIKLNVSPSINISKIDAGSQISLNEEMSHLNQLIPRQSKGADSVSFGSGFSISAYENIPVLLSFTTPVMVGKSNKHSGAVRILCGYLNDGTTYFRRATVTYKSVVQFRLRNNSLLKRSMKLNNPLFAAYVFFLTNQRKEDIKNEIPMPVSTVTVEFL